MSVYAMIVLLATVIVIFDYVIVIFDYVMMLFISMYNYTYSYQ